MKIGLISDIHGDGEHLQRALTLLQNLGANWLLCAGDLLFGEPHEDEVVEIIRSQQIPCTAGNHDSETEHLKSENCAFMMSLPQTLSFIFEEKRLLLTHATPWDNRIHVFSYSATDLLRRVISQSQSDAIIIGHTHEPMKLCIENTWIFNPGSVNRNRFEDNCTCAVLSLPEFGYTVYDLQTGEPLQIPALSI
jgi:putative phosphoesterase